MNLKLRQLAGFVALTRCGSFSAAARELAMTQPAFSQLIRQLENALQVRLFERTTRRVELTEAGTRFLAMVQRPLDDLEDAHVTMREIAGGKRGRIAFASLPSVAFAAATTALARFKAGHPHIHVRLIEEQNLNIVEKVLSREIDFGIGTLDTAHADLDFAPLIDDELVAVFPARHAFAKLRTVAWRDFANEPLVLLTGRSNVRTIVDRHLGRAAEPAYDVAGMVTALAMVRARLGVTAMPRIALGELNMNGLGSKPFGAPRPTRRIGIITHARRRLSPAAQAYVDLLFEEAWASPYNRSGRHTRGTSWEAPKHR
ncbi:MAG TPA: LysR family transcriptional regulator [Burkholderiales bacterium]|nr:LysR family transcriptional regulator [Burkholderiales bacterium]